MISHNMRIVAKNYFVPWLFVLLIWGCGTLDAYAGGAKSGTREPREVATEIDRLIQKKLADAKIPSSPAADDAEFIRRIHLDLAGRIPIGERAADFLASKDPTRRAKLVDELLAHLEYGRHFGILWHNRIVPLNFENSREFKRPFFMWLADSFQKNRRWSAMVSDLLLAEGDIAQTPALSFYMSPANTMEGYVHADRVAGTVSELFLGVNLRCAQCHDHPFAKWKQTEFWETAAFFGRVGFTKKFGEKKVVESKEVIARGGEKPVARADASIQIPGKSKIVKARFLKGELPDLDPEKPFRPAFVTWLTSPKNERFAAAAVNRMWHHFFGRGLVNPVNDMHEDNPATHPELMQMLTREFIASGHDFQHLIRCIVLSETYQRTSRPVADNKKDQEFYSHATLRQLNGEQLFDSLFMVLESVRYDKDLLKSVTNPGRDHWLQALSDIRHDLAPTRYTHGVPQALRLLNSSLTNGGEVPVIRKLLKDKTPRDKALDVLFLEVLARYPTAEERKDFTTFLTETQDPMTAYRNVWWVLLNTSEFAVNH